MYNDQQRKAAVDFEHRMVKRAIEMEGTVTVRALLFSPRVTHTL